MSYYGQEYEEYYRGIRRGQNISVKGGRREKKNHIKDVLNILVIQTMGIIVLSGTLYGFKIMDKREFTNIFDLAKTVVKEDYYFKNNGFFKVAEVSKKIEKAPIEKKVEELKVLRPALGEVVKNKDNTVLINNSKEVFASSGGRVTYVNKNKIVINHGEMVESIYENIENVQVKKGDKIEKNQLIGINKKEKSSVKFGVLEKGEFRAISLE